MIAFRRAVTGAAALAAAGALVVPAPAPAGALHRFVTRAPAASAVPAANTAATPQPIVGDFNGDGASDLLAYEPGSGADHLLYGTSFGLVSGPAVGINGTYVPLVGDFDGDGKSDIFWYDAANPTQSTIWLGATSGFAHGPVIHAPVSTSTNIYVPRTGDFDGDGKTDIIWANVGPGYRHAATNGSPVWYGNGTSFRVAPNVPTYHCTRKASCRVLSGDFNGDALGDVVWTRSGNQPDKLLYSNGAGFSSGPTITVSGVYAPVVGDFDGDGKTDIYFYAPGPAADNLWYGHTNGFGSVSAPISGSYSPLVGDFNGDGKSDIVWYAPGRAADYLRYGRATLFGAGPPINVNGSYAPAVGDFNGDGRDDIAWLAPDGHSSPVWYGAVSGFADGAPVTL